MTNSQFELFVMCSGMMQEGVKFEEALAHIIRSRLASSRDIAWLVTTRSKRAERQPSSVARVASA